MDVGGARKRGRPDASFNGIGGVKKFKPEMESFTTGLGSKSKPCTKFFSTSGCPFGEGCHFLHYVPGGIKAVSQIINVGSNVPTHPQPSRNPTVPSSFPDGSSPPSVKTRLCTRYNSAEGCKFGAKCHFAHGEWELGKPAASSYEDPHRAVGQMHSRVGRRVEPLPPAAASFGASATAKISINASLAGAIIGKNGSNSKQICRVTGAKLSIRDHDSDPNLKNIELEGSFDQIKQASAMVHELIANVGSVSRPPTRNIPSHAHSHSHSHGHPHGHAHASGPGSNLKTKLCENFAKGSCTFGERCHFAHGSDELRKSMI